jgi:type III pantothenate kinase
MSILLIDLGNTRLKWALAQSDTNHLSEDFDHQGSLPKGEVLSIVELGLNKTWAIEHIVCSSVISKEITASIQSAFEKIFPNAGWHQINGATLLEAITTSYTDAAQLGSDRRAMIIGAQALHPNKNLLIVGLGTASTIDLLTAQPHHHGGWILPGFSLMKEALATGTDRLPNGGLTSDTHLSFSVGIDTLAAINYGVLASQIGAIEMAKKYAAKEGVPLDLIILDGGNATQLIQDHYNNDLPIKQEANLVLKGLFAWWQSMSKK